MPQSHATDQPMTQKSKEEGKDIESIQPSTTPNLGHGKVTQTQENITHKRAKRPALSQHVTTMLQ